MAQGDISNQSSQGAEQRQIRPRRVWPGSRAAVGGLLVAVAGLGLFAAFNASESEPTDRYVVASTHISTGTTIGPQHVALVVAQLPDSIRDQAFELERQDSVLGAIALQPMNSGELIQRSNLGAEASTGAQISFEIATSRALNGQIQAGEAVDVIATNGSGSETQTQVVLHAATVVAVDRRDNSSLALDEIVVTISINSTEEAIAVAASVDTGKVTLSRSNPFDHLTSADPR